jgi:uncharacterized membrane protein YcaP (DUF421 family)
LSVLLKQGEQPATKTDVQVPVANFARIPMEIISDGQLIVRNLRELQVSEGWLMQELKKHGVGSIAEVFYAEVQEDRSLMLIR